MWPGASVARRFDASAGHPGEFSASQRILLSVAAFDKNIPCLLIGRAPHYPTPDAYGWRITARMDRMRCAPKNFGALSWGDFRYEHIWQETEEDVGGHSDPD